MVMGGTWLTMSSLMCYKIMMALRFRIPEVKIDKLTTGTESNVPPTRGTAVCDKSALQNNVTQMPVLEPSK